MNVMKTVINTGFIGCGISKNMIQATTLAKVEGLHLSKILINNKSEAEFLQLKHPDATLVQDVQSILDDTEIKLILIAQPEKEELNLVGAALQAGKNVRII